MKKFADGLKKILKNDFLCLALIIAALGYGVYFLCLSFNGVPNPRTGALSTGPLDISLTNMGRNTAYTARYFLFGILIALASLLNCFKLYGRAQCKSKLGYALVIFSAVSLLVTTFAIVPRSGRPSDNPIGYWIHSVGAFAFGISALLSTVPAFLHARKREGWFYTGATYWMLMLFDIPMLFALGMQALPEFYLFTVHLLMLLIVNFLGIFAPKEKPAAQTDEVRLDVANVGEIVIEENSVPTIETQQPQDVAPILEETPIEEVPAPIVAEAEPQEEIQVFEGEAPQAAEEYVAEKQPQIQYEAAPAVEVAATVPQNNDGLLEMLTAAASEEPTDETT